MPLTEDQRQKLIEQYIVPHRRESLGESVSHNHLRDGYRGLSFNGPDLKTYYESVEPESKYSSGFNLRGEVDAMTEANYLKRLAVDEECPARADVRVDVDGQPRFTVRFEGVQYHSVQCPTDEKKEKHGDVWSVIQLTKTHSAVPLHPEYRQPTRFNVYLDENGSLGTATRLTYECQVLPERFPETDLHLQRFFHEYLGVLEYVELSSDFRVLVHSTTVDQHIAHLEEVMLKLDQLQYPFTFGQSVFFVDDREADW